MRPHSIKILPLCIFSLFSLSLAAQQTTDAAGGEAAGSGGTVSYSVGQVVYLTNSGTGTEAQGVQQPYEISVITEVKETTSMSLAVWPNPATDLLCLKVDETKNGKLFYRLFDANGKLLDSHDIQSTETSINLHSCAAGKYFLHVYLGETDVKSFQIVKIH